VLGEQRVERVAREPEAARDGVGAFEAEPSVGVMPSQSAQKIANGVALASSASGSTCAASARGSAWGDGCPFQRPGRPRRRWRS
jgi:hypothetical protein